MTERNRKMYELEFPAPEVGSSDHSGPTLVVALHGYADAGQAIESGAKHLRAALEHRAIASFNADELIDYRSRRPAVTIDQNTVMRSESLDLGLDVLKDSQGHNFLLLSGPEPDMRWDAFTKAVRELADRFDVAQTVCLYAAPMAVPHTRPMVITAHGTNPDVNAQFFTMDSKFTVPGSAALHLEKALADKGHEVNGLTAHVPHYLAASDYPEATWRLLDAVAHIAELNLPLKSLQADAERVMAQVDEQVQESPEIQAVVHALEGQYDEELERYQSKQNKPALGLDTPLPTGEELGQEFERYLAEMNADTDGGTEDDEDI